jgi:hypothetical protein
MASPSGWKIDDGSDLEAFLARPLVAARDRYHTVAS